MSETVQPGTLYVVSTPIGNLDDITLRAIFILKNVDLIAAEDTRKTRILLRHLSIDKPLISHHSYNEARKAPELIRLLQSGKSVALVTDAGTPGISDPAFVLLREAIDHAVTVIPVPGPSALLPALIVSGLPTDRFVFEAFLPVKKGRKKKLEALASEERTVIIYESPFRMERTLRDLLEAFGNREVAVVREITKKFEEVERGPLEEVRERLGHKEFRGEYVIVLGGTRLARDREELYGGAERRAGEEAPTIDR
jgi:16S rRNA (cytidine1402-2'-O)-methyltransferase